MLINMANLDKKDINSRVHKVRAIIFDKENNLYVTNMDYSYNLPGGRVEVGEDIITALKREIKEELGIRVFKKDIKYIGNYIFWHKGFWGDNKIVNRENNIELFWLMKPQEVKTENIKLTNYEKHYHFCLERCSLEEVHRLLEEKNDNKYKTFTDVELRVLIDEYKKFRGDDNYVG